MIKTILIIQPNHDLTTNYLFFWAEKIIDIAKRKEIRVVALKSRRANKKEFLSINKKTNPQLIFFNGHGDYDLIAGQDNEVLVKSEDNDKCLGGRLVYALACRSAGKLGKTSVKQGTKAYLGYDEDFVFNYDLEKISKPLDDKVAQLFLKPSNLIVSSLLKGHTAHQSWENSQNDFKRRITAIVASKDRVMVSSYLPNLLWDMQHQVCLGDKKAVL